MFIVKFIALLCICCILLYSIVILYWDLYLFVGSISVGGVFSFLIAWYGCCFVSNMWEFVSFVVFLFQIVWYRWENLVIDLCFDSNMWKLVWFVLFLFELVWYICENLVIDLCFVSNMWKLVWFVVFLFQILWYRWENLVIDLCFISNTVLLYFFFSDSII